MCGLVDFQIGLDYLVLNNLLLIGFQVEPNNTEGLCGFVLVA